MRCLQDVPAIKRREIRSKTRALSSTFHRVLSSGSDCGRDPDTRGPDLITQGTPN